MKLRRLKLILLAMLVFVAASCDSPTDRQVEPAATAPTCTKKVEINPSNATPYPTPSTPVAGPIEEIYEGLVALQASLEGESENSITTQSRQYIWDKLWKKQVVGWQGWIVSMDSAALINGTGNSLGMGAYDSGGKVNPNDYEFETDPLLVSMTNPYTDTDTTKLTSIIQSSKPQRVGFPLIMLTGVKQLSNERLCLGTKVEFSGEIIQAPDLYSNLELNISHSTVRVLDTAVPTDLANADLQGVIIQLHRIPGWTGAQYSLTVFGDGLVLYNGGGADFRIAMVKPEIIREILAEFDKVDFEVMPQYDEYGVSDAPYAITTLVRGEQGKRVVHYFGNDMPDEKIRQLEGKIDELINTDQFVGWCGTEREKYLLYPCPAKK